MVYWFLVISHLPKLAEVGLKRTVFAYSPRLPWLTPNTLRHHGTFSSRERYCFYKHLLPSYSQTIFSVIRLPIFLTSNFRESRYVQTDSMAKYHSIILVGCILHVCSIMLYCMHRELASEIQITRWILLMVQIREVLALVSV